MALASRTRKGMIICTVAAGVATIVGLGGGTARAADGGVGGVIGGAALGGHGVIVNNAPGVRKLPGIRASSWVVADADTGQVLAAKDPHGEYRRASALKVLTAVALIPALSHYAFVRASSMAASQTPNDICLLAGHSYKVSDLFTALLTISANDAAVALTQGTGSYARGMSIINAATSPHMSGTPGYRVTGLRQADAVLDGSLTAGRCDLGRWSWSRWPPCGHRLRHGRVSDRARPRRRGSRASSP